jgi:hypothetical protein
MATNPLSAGFPSAPFLDPDGDISVAWRNWLLTIDRRTGGPSGTTAADTSLIAETTARIQADATLETEIANETTAREGADSALSDRINALNRSIQTNQASTDLSVAASIASEQAARILGDTVLSVNIAAIRWGALLVNGDVPVGIICNPDGTPIYVEEPSL